MVTCYFRYNFSLLVYYHVQLHHRTSTCNLQFILILLQYPRGESHVPHMIKQLANHNNDQVGPASKIWYQSCCCISGHSQMKIQIKHKYIKQERVIWYLEDIIDIPSILGIDGDNNTLILNVDAPFWVHADMRSHSDTYLIWGRGTIIPLSYKQKLETKWLTKVELVKVDNIISFIMWTQYLF